MAERIDFALEPGVIVFAVFFFLVANVLLATVVLPYFRNQSSAAKASNAATSPDAKDFIENTTSDRKPVEERVDEFLEDMERGRAA